MDTAYVEEKNLIPSKDDISFYGLNSVGKTLLTWALPISTVSHYNYYAIFDGGSLTRWGTKTWLAGTEAIMLRRGDYSHEPSCGFTPVNKPNYTYKIVRDVCC